MEWIYGLIVFVIFGYFALLVWWIGFIGRWSDYANWAIPIAVAPILLPLYIVISLIIGASI